jgi:ElaB/YqjD/DUF883 family membrane-anchored ribosome-binding protein
LGKLPNVVYVDPAPLSRDSPGIHEPLTKGFTVTNEANMEKLVADLKTLSQDAEAVLQSTAGQAGEKMGELRNRLSNALASAKASCQRIEEKAVAGAKVADKTIREHPYESIGVAFGVGLLVGVLVTRR